MIGLIGEKVGMTRVFTEDGRAIPVSVIMVKPHEVAQIKLQATEGYNAIQLVTDEKKASRISKPIAGHLAKAQVKSSKRIKEFRVDAPDTYSLGQVINVAEIFVAGQYVDVEGTSKGKGFAGGVKRHNFATQDASHGNSVSHRVLGSIGQNQTPGKVFKGKKMAGHLGSERCTVQNLEIIRIDNDRNVILIKGAIPGHPGAQVIIKPAVKKEREE